MAKVWNRRRIETWLIDEPREVIIAVATRAALSATPFLASGYPKKLGVEPQTSLIFSLFRATLTCAVAATVQKEKVKTAAAATYATTDVDAAKPVAAAGYAAGAVNHDAEHAIVISAGAVDYAARAASATPDVAAFWEQVGFDVDIVTVGDRLLEQPLWSKAPPDVVTRLRDELNDWLSRAPGFAFWSRWYAAMEAGQPMDWDLQTEIALIPNEIWKAGPEVVAAEIARIQFKYRTNVSPPTGSRRNRRRLSDRTRR